MSSQLLFYSFLNINIYIFKLFICSFIYFWPCWVFITAWGFSAVVASGGHPLVAVASLLAERRLKTHGLPWFQRPALESRLQGCGAQAQWLHGVWDLPRPRIEPASPAQAGGFFFTPEPREKPSFQLLIVQTVHVLTAGGNLKDLRLLIRFLLSCRDGGVDQQPARPTATAGSSSLCRNTGNFL